jgi:membrane protease YdiL (CAAX protease family)
MTRFLAFPLTRLILIVLLFGMLAKLMTPVALRMHSLILNDALVFAMLLAATLVVEYFCAHQTVADVGFPSTGAISGLFGGLLIGAILFSVVIAILALAHCYTATFQTWNGLFAALAFFLIAALVEELLFRGILFRLIEKMTGTWIALALSALLFGAIHVGNPHATLFSGLAIALEAGVLLALAYALTRSLWFAIGIHWGWNLFEGPIFGTQVSGGQFTATVMHAKMDGPHWLTGGSFGPEAGVAAIVVCLAAAIVVGVLAIRQRHIISPMWAAFAA